jgi:ATP-binding cassette subfamily B multidrug efflux pump
MRGGFGGPWGGAGLPAEKPMKFGPSVRRLVKRLSPEGVRLVGVIALGVTSVVFLVVGPKILGRATDLIFAGAIGKRLPPGLTADQVIAAARASGHSNLADLLARMHVVPGQGIDFNALGGVLMLALGLYAASAVFGWMQGYLLNDVVQRTVFQLRSDVEDKLGRLPLQYFDKQPRGEILSRVTNDIDNVALSLQQTISQLLTSALTVVGVVVMMFVVSPLLAVVMLITVPLSLVITTQVAKRSQKLFAAQWALTGALNGHIEEAFTGHELVKVFGRQREVEQVFK